MSTAAASVSALSDARIVVICIARVLLFATFMTGAATIPLLMSEWGLTATAAGAIVSSFTIGYAISLFLFAWAADFLGAKRMVAMSAVAAGATSLAFGLYATDWWSAMILYGLAGLAQGGVYTPVIMVLSDEVEPARRGNAMGWLIASTSAGYAASLAVAGVGIAIGGWQMAFLLTGLLPAVGAILLIVALLPLPNRIHPRKQDVRVADELVRNRESRLLTLGYTTHCWELLGMWAWIPAFLAVSFVLKGADSAGATVSGAYLGGALHVFGAAAAFTMGRLSDRVGRRPVLIVLAAAGAAMSFLIGWLIHIPAAILVPLAFAYAFLCIGDSPVLTTATSEAVRPGYLGAVLAWRGLMGFGAGAVAPLGFGLVLDVTSGLPPAVSWGLAFGALGIGGTLALWCALALRRTS
jgi:MFS family permease